MFVLGAVVAGSTTDGGVARERPNLNEQEASAAVRAARAYLGAPYRFGGRGADGGHIDCLGIVFAAMEAATGCAVSSFSDSMTDSLSRAELGELVPGLAPGRSEPAIVGLLRKGDVLLFAGTIRNSREPPAASVGGTPIWVWHAGLYAGERMLIVADPKQGVIETPLDDYMRSHAKGYPYLFAARPTSKPKVRHCREVARPAAAITAKAADAGTAAEMNIVRLGKVSVYGNGPRGADARDSIRVAVPALEACFTEAVQRGSDGGARMYVSLDVAPDGRVRKVIGTETTSDDAALSWCAESALRRVSFPASRSDGGYEVGVPMDIWPIERAKGP